MIILIIFIDNIMVSQWISPFRNLLVPISLPNQISFCIIKETFSSSIRMNGLYYITLTIPKSTIMTIQWCNYLDPVIQCVISVGPRSSLLLPSLRRISEPFPYPFLPIYRRKYCIFYQHFSTLITWWFDKNEPVFFCKKNTKSELF